MITFDEMEIILDEIACEIPKEFYRELNGGILLLPETKYHPESHRQAGELYIMGEYYNDRKGYGGLGRYIKIYYGSFMQLYPNMPPQRLREELKKVLIHEFTHHLESLAGERDLEIKDAVDLERYRLRLRRREK